MPPTSITFTRTSLPEACWFTFWPFGEMHLFRDKEAAISFADRHCLKPVFVELAGDADDEETPTI